MGFFVFSRSLLFRLHRTLFSCHARVPYRHLTGDYCSVYRTSLNLMKHFLHCCSLLLHAGKNQIQRSYELMF